MNQNLKDFLAKKSKKNDTSDEKATTTTVMVVKKKLPFDGMLPESWLSLLSKDLDTDEIRELETKVNDEYEHDCIFPPKAKIFRALELCPVEKVKVVILGQDPYHTFGQANGLAFSCEETPLQPSLKNLFLEVSRDVESTVDNDQLVSGDLSPWATQGVLLLNWTLTVKSNRAASHKGLGWQHLTQALIRRLSAVKPNLVFLLWGRHAHEAVKFIQDPKKHLILKSSHPSPFSYTTSSAGIPSFCNCGHFKKCNEYLLNVVHRKEINWN